jgi:hypothetical protein
LTTAHRGGIHFQHGARQRFTSIPHNRGGYFAPRQRFGVSPGAEPGSTLITLDEDESVVVGTNDDGSVAVTITTRPVEEDNGTSPGPQAATAQPATRRIGRNFLRSRRARMNVVGNADSSITVEPDPGNELLVVGDPSEGEIEIVEVRPAEPVA